jgi:hypothetical protein
MSDDVETKWGEMTKKQENYSILIKARKTKRKKQVQVLQSM